MNVVGPGVLSALLGRQEAPSESLRVMLCGDAIVRPDCDPVPASRGAAQVLTAALCHNVILAHTAVGWF